MMTMMTVMMLIMMSTMMVNDDDEKFNKLIYITNCKTSGARVLRVQTKASNPANIFSVQSTSRNERGFTREKKKK